jgi:hypothetical protein
MVEAASSGSGAIKVVQQGGSRTPFFDPLGYRGARDAKRTGQAAQTAAFLRGMQDLFPASLPIGMGSWVLATLSSTRPAAIQLFAHSEHAHCIPERRVFH